MKASLDTVRLCPPDHCPFQASWLEDQHCLSVVELATGTSRLSPASHRESVHMLTVWLVCPRTLAQRVYDGITVVPHQQCAIAHVEVPSAETHHHRCACRLAMHLNLWRVLKGDYRRHPLEAHTFWIEYLAWQNTHSEMVTPLTDASHVATMSSPSGCGSPLDHLK